MRTRWSEQLFGLVKGMDGRASLNDGLSRPRMTRPLPSIGSTYKNAHRFGIQAKVEKVDWQAIIRRVYDEIDAEAHGVEEENRQDPNITVYKGTGRFVGKKTLEVEGEEVRAETIVIAAGTRPAVPPVPGLSEAPYLTSDQALRLPERPRRLLVLGGGYIAAELAHFYGSLGTEVTIVHRGPRLLRDEDEEVARRFTEVYQRKLNLLLDAQLTRVTRDGNAVVAEVSQGGRASIVVADALLLATGRVPKTDLLQVARTSVEVDARGFVRTDEFLETSVPSIWALGDIVGKYFLKHSANLEAAYVAYNIFSPGQKVAADYNAMPHAIFASPQVAGVELTEQEAKQHALPYTSATWDYADTAYGSSVQDRDGFVKVLAHSQSREILGCRIIGSEASILIQEVANAMRQRLTTDAITQSIYVHPALPEVVQRAFGALQV